MKALVYFGFLSSWLIIIMVAFIPTLAVPQEITKHLAAYEDYADEVLNQEEDFIESLEEWQNMIDHWLENPLCINNEETDWLMEYKIISLLQLNKLKEYRFKYGNILSVYELAFVDGWDFQTVRKVIPLVTTLQPKNSRSIDKFNFRSFQHKLVLKSAVTTQKSKGYMDGIMSENSNEGPVYTGHPIRLALRYDLEYRDKIRIGIRVEKDPGEPMLISSSSKHINIKTPDLIGGYLHLKKIGPLQSVLLGNYRVNFGYGVNLSGGQSAIKSRNGMTGMAHKAKPHSSVSETGFYRGLAILAQAGPIFFSGFASMRKIDGTSIVIDSLSGKPVSFSSIDRSGLHRTASELEKRKTIPEKVVGGFLVYHNNWLKAGLIALYNQFSASIITDDSPYARFGLSGKGNLVAGMSATIWIPGIQLFMESSISRNKGMAIVSGLQLLPAPGALIVITHRFFGVEYQNWNGSGFISSSRNSGENGFQVSLRVELHKKWLLEFSTDHSRSQWASYGFAAPARQHQIKVITEKAWRHSRSLVFSFRYHQKLINDPDNAIWICHPVDVNQFNFRLEGRIEARPGVRLKSRLEYNLAQNNLHGWLFFQDIEFASERLRAKFWIRACLFDAINYENRMYAYENDVLYDFTSFLLYGKGLRGIILVKISPLEWLDIWLRVSTVYYSNKRVGSGWDEVEGQRQNEIETQLRIKLSH